MSESSLPLVTRARERNREAVEELLLRHLPGLQAWLRLRMGAQLRARETPEDLVQSVAREVLGGLEAFEWRGEAFGDGGLVMAMLWGLALVALTISGCVLYLQMRRPGATGWRRFFW